MKVSASIPILARSRWNRKCTKCDEPITLGKRADRGNWVAFNPDPVPLGVVQENQGVVEWWDSGNTHQCHPKDAAALRTGETDVDRFRRIWDTDKGEG